MQSEENEIPRIQLAETDSAEGAIKIGKSINRELRT